MKLLELFFKKREPEPRRISVLLLQKRLERFSTERLNAAMQRGWHRDHDPQTFFARSIFDGDGGLLKVGTTYFTVRHFDRRLERNELGDFELPNWAEHSGYSSVEYKCRGGVPEGTEREKMYAFLGLLCTELLSENCSGLFFLEERVAVQNTATLSDRLRSAQPLNPHSLAAQVSANY